MQWNTTAKEISYTQKNIESHFKPDRTSLNMPAERKNIQIIHKILKRNTLTKKVTMDLLRQLSKILKIIME